MTGTAGGGWASLSFNVVSPLVFLTAWQGSWASYMEVTSFPLSKWTVREDAEA